MLNRRFSRALVPFGGSIVGAALAAGVLLVGVSPTGAAAATPPPEATVCFDAALARTRTEVDADLSVPQFDPALGTLLEVTVTGPSTHLDTDAVFESTAASAVTFSEQMTYQVVVVSPGGLPSPAPITGTVVRIPTQTLTAFDGTLDYLGTSAVAQPSIARTDSAASTSSTAPAVLAAFTGSGTMPFHLTSTISETFTGGGGNVQAIINTFMAAEVGVCYRYALPVEVGGVVTPPPAERPRPQLAFTGSSDGLLVGAGGGLLAFGALLAWRARGPRPSLDA